MRTTGACRRFEEEGLLRLERGEALNDEHYRGCNDCITLLHEYEHIKRVLPHARRLHAAPELAAHLVACATDALPTSLSAGDGASEAAQTMAMSGLRSTESNSRWVATTLGAAALCVACGWLLIDRLRSETTSSNTIRPAPSMVAPQSSRPDTPTEAEYTQNSAGATAAAITAGAIPAAPEAPYASSYAAAPSLTRHLPRPEDDPCKDMTSFALKLCRERQKRDVADAAYGDGGPKPPPPTKPGDDVY